MAEIVFDNVSKRFGNTKVIENLNLKLEDGKFTVLLGPSGCGKTTLLRMIAGIGPATEGKIYMDGEDISDVPPGKRNVAMVFQSYAIYPTMSVRENIEFCLKNNKISKEERERRVQNVAKIVGLEDYMNRKPSQLSGGQRQRIALARAMVKEPAVFLMDEPLSNLDAKLRATMRSELIQLHEELKTTFVYVTHDQVESMAMADYIVLMNQGKIMQQASPKDIYNDPDNIFTAQFIGTPATNILQIKDSSYKLGYRPEKVDLSDEKPTEDYIRQGIVLTREMLGSEVIYKIQIPGGEIMVKSQCFQYNKGDSVWVSVRKENIYFFDDKDNRIRENLESLYKSIQE